jgi:hypothetical protein
MLAIMLYRELPVVAFEGERRKEEVLIERGNQYARAAKLYVRKFQTFPPSIDALENTNRMRFLRKRYVDPYSGKDDWRFLHAGPGGVITDSKVKQTGSGLNGAAGSSTPTGAPAAVSNVFNNSFDGSNPNGQPAAAGNGFPQRPPAMAANGGVATADNSDPNAGVSSAGQQQTDPSNPTASAGPPVGVPGRFTGTNLTTSYQQGQFGGSSPPVAGGSDSQSTFQSLLNTQNPAPTVQNGGTNNSAPGGAGTSTNASSPSAFGSSSPTSGTGTQMGSMGAGGGGGLGIAGVASKSAGRTIKIINDQTDRSLWEFVYDMQKEAQANAPGLGNPANGGAANTNGAANGTNGNGTNGSTSGQSSFFNSNGSGNTQTNPPPSQPPAQSQN